MDLQEYIDRFHEIGKEDWGTARDPLTALPKKELAALIEETLRAAAIDKQENALKYYEPASGDARKIHLSTTKHCLATGGNRSGKSESMLVDGLICMTKIIPFSLKDFYPKEKIRCPMRTRLMVTSRENTWEPVIKPKLQWNVWNGRGEPGGPYGHWGWIPKRFLIRGKWDESWSEKHHTLTLICGCTMQVMSYEQDVEELRGVSLHLVMNDEGSKRSHYDENKMRTVDVAGRLIMAMTPPDDENDSWDAAWIYDDLYVKGLPGPGKDPDIDAFTLFTEHNRILDLAEIERVTKDLSPERKEVRQHGRFMHLSGRIYKDYSNRPQMWCFGCNKISLCAENKCLSCGNGDTVEFCHFIEPFEEAYRWPVCYYIDPHPQKDHMMLWIAVSPGNEYYQIGEASLDMEPADVKKEVDDFEQSHSLEVYKRTMDSKMAGQAAHAGGRRGVNIRQEFDNVGLRCDLADNDFIVGKGRVKELFKLDRRTKAPRLFIFNTCVKTDYQLMHYVWDTWGRPSEKKDPKQEPMKKNDDFPSLLRYLANDEPTYSGLNMGMGVMKRAANSRQRGY